VTGAGHVATVRDTTATGMTQQGFVADSGGELNIESCVAANNAIGISCVGSSTVRVSNTTVTDNGTGIDPLGNVLSRGNNTVEGNATNGTFTAGYAAK
jgi:parallel beta-helix repeat protein